MIRLDHTKKSTFVLCPAKYEKSWKRHLKPEFGSTALRYGIVWHDVMEAYYSHIADNGWTRDGEAVKAALRAANGSWTVNSHKQDYYEDYRTLPNLLQAFVEYLTFTHLDEGIMKIIAPEAKFEIEMFPKNAEEEAICKARKLDGLIFTGKIDCEIELSGRFWNIEFKTTGQPILRQTERLQRSPQVIGYTYAASQIRHIPSEGTLLTVHQLMSRRKKNGEYGKLTIDFKRPPMIFSEADIVDWRLQMFDIASKIQFCEKENIWPKYLDSCYTYGRCTYANLCEQNRKPEDENITDFIVDPWDVTTDKGWKAEFEELKEKGEV